MPKRLTAEQAFSRSRLFDEAATCLEVYQPDPEDDFMEDELLEKDYVYRKLHALSLKWHIKASKLEAEERDENQKTTGN